MVKIMIKRIFHPIGQGAFYSERHENFNIVYDCGNWKNTKLADKVVKQSFKEGESIDILFISHFDYDHVNKIKTLKEHTKIKKVVMPLLHDNEKHLLMNIYRLLVFNILTIISNPKDFFGHETEIITVNYTDNIESPADIDSSPQKNINELTSSTIQSGTTLIQKFENYDWIYIPYNYCHKDRNKKLEDLLVKHGFDVKKFKHDPEYTTRKVTLNRAKLKKIYSALDGNINQNSMLLYSGVWPTSPKLSHWHLLAHYLTVWYTDRYAWHEMCHEVLRDMRDDNENKVGCVYTGDCDLNKVDIKLIFQHYWKYVSTIQLPHHGDVKSYNNKTLGGQNYLCPISVGINNTYGHPSPSVISDIICNGSCPILVTESLSSYYIEHIEEWH